MVENTKIEWATHTFNPWEGCQKVGPGCDHCYAEARDQRFTGGTHWGPSAPRRRTSAANWAKPLKWNREAALSGTRPRVFCASLADVFDNAVDPAWREDLWRLIAATPNLDWLLLTKRPGNIANMLPVPFDFDRHFPHVWLGCTVVNQDEADRDIPKLLEVPAKVRFLSIEPMLGPIDLHRWMGVHHHPDNRTDDPATLAAISEIIRAARAKFREDTGVHGIDWIICGGESGPHSRPMNPQWARDLRDQCVTAGVPFHFKQNGEWVSVSEVEGPGEHFKFPDGRTVRRTGKKLAGRTLDGRTWDEVPA